jgi:hypothetical protein
MVYKCSEPSVGAMSSSSRANPFVRPGQAPEYPVRFRFPVTWACLSAPMQVALLDAPLRESPVFTAPAPPLTHQPAPVILPNRPIREPMPAPPPAGAQWEMVVPKMSRPTRPQIEAPRAEPSLAELSGAQTPPTAPALLAAVESEHMAAPFFNSGSASHFEWKPALIAAGTLGILIAGAGLATRSWTHAGPEQSGVSRNSGAAVQNAGWEREPAKFAPGSKQDRQLVLYHARASAPDYRLEYEWIPSSKGVGWVFRATDSANYYAARLSLVPWKTTPTLSVEHFAVINGVEGPHTRNFVPLDDGNASTIKIRMDAIQAAFALYVQNFPVDRWIDARLPNGNAGFYQEKNESPAVRSVRLSFFSSAEQEYRGTFPDLLKTAQDQVRSAP